MGIILRSLVIAFIMKEIPSKKCYIFYYEDVSHVVRLPEYLNYTVKVVNKSSLNAEVNVLKPIANPYWKIELHSKIRNTDIVFFNKTTRYCDFGRLAQHNTIFKNMLLTFRETTNLDFKCPVCKCHYFIRNLYFQADSLPLGPAFSAKDGFQVIVAGYIKEQRKLKEIGSIRFLLTVEKLC
ncbi:unnamed protein product [Hermetia illucens]|uniref:Uncharacterized protein n=1 Tax=Hermetia illucens TaxID=343691 RepID=A0A7R8YSL6_HERIL|nr:unnamed protein product [Hermetia illucens]